VRPFPVCRTERSPVGSVAGGGGKTSITAGAANDITLANSAATRSPASSIVIGNNVTLNDTAATFQVRQRSAAFVISLGPRLTAAGRCATRRPPQRRLPELDQRRLGLDHAYQGGQRLDRGRERDHTGLSDILITDVTALVLGTISPGTGDGKLVGGRTRSPGPGRSDLRRRQGSSLEAGPSNNITAGSTRGQLHRRRCAHRPGQKT